MRNERRWQQAWFFLSLDQTAPYFGDLWVPLEGAFGFQNSLREQLKPWLDRQEEYYSNFGSINYLLADWFQTQHGWQKIDQLSGWVRDIFLHEGPDRMAETVWSQIPYHLPPAFKTDLPVADWLVEVLTKVKDEQKADVDELEKRLIIDGQKPVSAWDAAFLPVEWSEPQDIRNSISLIGTYNIFLKAWEKYCANFSHAQLNEIYAWGKHVAANTGMQDLNVVFPGAWRFELHSILETVTLAEP
jgi:hypothetical protein